MVGPTPISEVIIEDYSDITRIRGRTLSKVTLRFFESENPRHKAFLAAAHLATRTSNGVVIVEPVQRINYVHGV